MSFQDLLGWLGQWQLYFWLIVLVGGYFMLRRMGMELRLSSISDKLLISALVLGVIAGAKMAKELGDIAQMPILAVLLFLALVGYGAYQRFYKKKEEMLK